ncbi:MAG TPA: carbon-nitrogen hydrolase family protein [Mycobacterium sp.]|nr:carbon-nitrogen hydrolase family protein [Mycobacterium sp.]
MFDRKRFRAGAVQAEPIWLDARATVEKTVGIIAEAAESETRLLAFPELWLPGYPGFMLTHSPTETMPFLLRYRDQSVTVDGPEIETIRAAARRHGVAVAFGLSERAGATLYMSQLLIDHDGTVKLHRRKLKPTRFERELFGQGDGSDLQVCDSSCGRIGALNCAENLQSLNKFALAAQGEQIHISSWPFPLGSATLTGASMCAINQTYAAENGAFVLMSTIVFGQDAIAAFDMAGSGESRQYLGGGYASVFGPDTSRLSEPIPPTVEGIAYADIDFSLIERAKHTLDPTGHYARPDVFSVTIDRRRKPPVTEITDVVDEPFEDAVG